MSEDTKQAAQTEEQASTSNPELTVQDLGTLKQVIDVASTRGAFKPNEMLTVGQVYTKLETFLNAVTAQQQQAEGDKGGE